MSETRGSARGKSAETLNSILNFLSDFEKEENVDLSSHNNNHHHNNTHNSTHNNTHNNNNNNDRDGSKLLLPPARTGERAEHASGTSVLTELLQFSLETGSEPSTRRRQGTNAKSTELAAAAPATETAPGSDVVASARVEYDGAATTRGHSAADSTISLISRRMKTARVQLAEKQAEIDVLRGQVAERDRRIAELDGSASKEAIALKAENERTIARHLETISKLVSDKGKLTQKIASLLRGFERVEAEYQEKIKHMKARYDADFDGKREVLRQQEKQRRLKWEKAKVEEIREITVQGLQPEIQRLLEVHKANLRKKDQDAEDRLATLRRQLMQVGSKAQLLVVLSACVSCLGRWVTVCRSNWRSNQENHFPFGNGCCRNTSWRCRRSKIGFVARWSQRRTNNGSRCSAQWKASNSSLRI
eukprot:INCI17666.3.p1 GENE.INCI17666.3~~INCI17666.3.p1  ORF type:complete len:419 (-),score=91.11 INCI17666.3:1854-3110(-)